MKTVLLMIVTWALVVFSAAAAVPSKDAASHVGESGVVRGTVVQVAKFGNLTFLNFGQPHPNSEFTAVVRSASEEFGDLSRWQGQTVEVVGKITLFKNRPQIEVHSPSDLRAASGNPTVPIASVEGPSAMTASSPVIELNSGSEKVGTTSQPESINVAPGFDKKTNEELLDGRIEFPRGTFHSDFIAAAQAEARAENKPIAIIYTNKDTTCGLCVNATKSMTDALRSSAILVYVRDANVLPRSVAKELSSRGEYIPKVAVFDAELGKFFGMVTYEEVKADGDRPLRALKRQI
ncbi:MAG: hypothetical protein SFU53_01295 [Terrimicrobiaceae bacterium]|nr:hypothetical protein [Terrimicrobiaceae bacterium]